MSHLVGAVKSYAYMDRGSLVEKPPDVELDETGCTVTVVEGHPVPLDVNGMLVEVAPGEHECGDVVALVHDAVDAQPVGEPRSGLVVPLVPLDPVDPAHCDRIAR